MSNREVFFFSGTHWDREWYQTYQGFRFRLVKMVDDLLDALETLDDFNVFHFDGQTIVLDDYAEIKPHNAGKLKSFIKNNRIKVGPWYVMPDEFTVSGESLIRNLMLGHERAKAWGADEAWKFGYICDIFGHIAQMPQIFNGFGIKYSYLSRGCLSTSEPYFMWQSPDGSNTLNFRIGNLDGYGEFTIRVMIRGKENCDDIKEPLCDYMNYLFTTSKIPVYIVSDAMDHFHINRETGKCIQLIKDNFPDTTVYHTDLIDAGKALEKYKEQMPVVEGELIKTNKVGFPDVVSNTLSSRYPLKKANDKCQNKLEKVLEPMLAYASITGEQYEREYIRLAYKYLIQNHPHDSICGCSIDQVHKDMEYRFDQVMELCKAVEDDFMGKKTRPYLNGQDKDTHGILTLVNTLPYERDEVVTIDVPLKRNYPFVFAEPFGYEGINSFTIRDSSGCEIPYQITDIHRDRQRRLFDQRSEWVDYHRVTFRVKVPPMGKAEYRFIPGNRPVRYLNYMSSGADYMENEYIRVTFNPDGTINIYDKLSDCIYENQLSFRDDGEIGDGWYHVTPKNNASVYSAGGNCIIENIELGCSRCVFRITKDLYLPKEMDIKPGHYSRSREYVKSRVIMDVGISENSKSVDVSLTYDNNVKDHCLSLIMPTYTGNPKYFAGQAFYCVERDAGIDVATQDWNEYEKHEKNMNGIAGRRDAEKNGLAFVSAEGLHECGAYNDDYSSIYITLLRGFSRTVKTNGETAGQIIGEHQFKFNLVPLREDVKYSDLLRIQDKLATSVITAFAEVESDAPTNETESVFSLKGENISLSVIKCAERVENAVVVRVFNASCEPSYAEMEFAKTIKNAKSVNLNEEDMPDSIVTFEGNKAQLPVNPWSIQTLVIEF